MKPKRAGYSVCQRTVLAFSGGWCGCRGCGCSESFLSLRAAVNTHSNKNKNNRIHEYPTSSLHLLPVSASSGASAHFIESHAGNSKIQPLVDFTVTSPHVLGHGNGNRKCLVPDFVTDNSEMERWPVLKQPSRSTAKWSLYY